MNREILSIRNSLNKAYLKVKPIRSGIELFKSGISELIANSNSTESEEHHKNIIATFLKKTYYDPDHYINTKGRTDLVIHNGKDSKSSVGVIIETKRPGSRFEMPSKENLNTKAVHELILYYLRERITDKNLEIKHLIATDLNEWFIFNAQEFERLFASNKKLVKDFEQFERGAMSGIKTDFFYNDIAKPFLECLDRPVQVTHFKIADFREIINNSDKKDDNKLIGLYKIFSPEHLLKMPFSNDSNTLDRKFYNELLHIIGLEETKDGSKKIIGRKAEKSRNSDSLLENTINILKFEDSLNQLPKPSDFGNTQEERHYAVALELCITWINRILFLKLLEGQLIRYHNGDEKYKFLNSELIPGYDALNKLFFQVLAVKEKDRNEKIKQIFGTVPYLNSSLFEPTELEQKTIRISNLDDDGKLPIIAGTVIKDHSGNKVKGEEKALHYLLKFLDSYDFSSEGKEDISEENKTLINASVLGLIFEKINGYKDGSFFTPGFITMYMCKETIRRAVVQKFNDAKGLKCETIDDVYNKIEDKAEANSLINCLKICDPAVGSGHFLVSALNEIITIKSELRILADKNGKLLKDYHVEVINDELVITDIDGEFFEYHPKNPESQRIQETLFHEKQTIIENCLFGVDINQNSVKICRLRLWIELLKNAYYKSDSGYTELETLPNIDINIKCGNSLISRYPLAADIKKALKRSKWSIESYRAAVMTYRNAENKDQKAEMRRLIDQIKSDFESEVASNDKRFLKLNKLKGELTGLTSQTSLFSLPPKEKAEWNKKVSKITSELNVLEKELEEIKSNKIYEHAFEWRFEFPEVLNDEGDFVGFDVVIGNPPYIRAEELSHFKEYLKQTFKVYISAGDIFSYFYELAYRVLCHRGKFCFINNTYDKTTAGKILRNFVFNNYKIEQYIDFTSVIVFEEATTYPIILLASKELVGNNYLKFLKVVESQYNDKVKLFCDSNFVKILQNSLSANVWNFRNENEIKLLTKLNKSKKVIDLFGKSYRGILTGLNEAFIVNEKISKDIELKPVYDGKDIAKWTSQTPLKWMIVFKCKSTKLKFGNATEEEAKLEMSKQFPEIFKKLLPFEELSKGRFDKGEYWWELRNCAYYGLFEKPKIIFPNLQNKNKFAFDETGTYLNAPSVFLPNVEHYLLGILNSNTVWYFLKSICVIRNGGYIEVKPQYFEQIPIPEIPIEAKEVLTKNVNKIITLRKSNPSVDISVLEAEIDQLVYDLYGLTEEEIKIVEGALN